MSFLNHFDKKYSKKLAKRAKTFRSIFEILEQRNRHYYLIIEMGCARMKDNYVGDGMSTILFDEFVNFYNGQVLSVDINEDRCKFARKITSDKTIVTCEDSVKFLWELDPAFDIDLLYLDSFYINRNNPHPSMFHHMKEFCAIIGKLNKETLVIVDDHFDEKVGKGAYISDFMKNLGYERFIDDYQIGWVL